MFINSEIIAGLWFLPVVLFILIPLAVSCFSLVHQVLKIIVGNIGQAHRSTKKERESILILQGSA